MNGSIILMHDGGGNRAQTLKALPTIIESLLHRGFKFVTLQQMVDDLQRKIAKPVPRPKSPGSISWCVRFCHCKRHAEVQAGLHEFARRT